MFLICGEALYDVFTSEPQGDAVPLLARPGGSPFNVAIGLSRLGSQAALLSGLSTDALGRHLADILRREGVLGDYVVPRQERTTLSLVAVDAQGAAQYTFYGEKAADRALQTEDIPPLQDDVHGIHLGSYTLVAEPTASTLLDLAARERGRRLISLDPNVRPTVEPDMARWRARVATAAALADVIKVSIEDLALLYPKASAQDIAQGWLAAGCRLVIVTLGADGATAFGSKCQVHAQARAIPIVDTIGAGDSFQAALLHQLPTSAALDDLTQTHEAMSQMLQYCVAAASITCGRAGANPPTAQEVRNLLAGS